MEFDPGKSCLRLSTILFTIMSRTSSVVNGLYTLMIVICLNALTLDVCTAQLDDYDDYEDISNDFDFNLNDKDEDGTRYVFSSQDFQRVTSYSNGPLGLTTMLQSSLTPLADGGWEKTRKTALFSYGSEKLALSEASKMTIIDATSSNPVEYGYEIDETLNGFSFPFAVAREDLWKLSASDSTLSDSISTTYLLLPSNFDQTFGMDQLAMAFGKDSNVKEITFQYDSATRALVLDQSLGLDLSNYFADDTWDMFDEVFNNKEIWGLLHDMASKEKARREAEENAGMPQRFWWEESEGGVTCLWGRA